jgi:hypothetical protein
MNLNTEIQTVGYTPAERAEMAAHLARKSLAAKWQARAAAERDAMTELAGLANKWRARSIRETVEARLESIATALGAEPAPFLLSRPVKRYSAPLRRRSVRAYVSQTVAACAAVFG